MVCRQSQRSNENQRRGWIVMSFLQELVEAYNKKGLNCQIEMTNFPGSTEKVLFLSVEVKLEDRIGEAKFNLDKFSKSFGKMLLMNNGDINSTCSEFLIMIKKLCESGCLKLFNEKLIDKSKVIE